MYVFNHTVADDRSRGLPRSWRAHCGDGGRCGDLGWRVHSRNASHPLVWVHGSSRMLLPPMPRRRLPLTTPLRRSRLTVREHLPFGRGVERARRPQQARHRRVPGRTATGRRRACRRAADQPAGGLAAPEGAQGSGAGHRAGSRHPPDLSAQPGGRGRPARSARHVLEPRAGRLPGRRRTSRCRRATGRRSHDPDSDRDRTHGRSSSQAPIERAFTVFTERFGDFKPPEHNLLGAPHRRDRVRAAGRRSHL